MRRKTKTPAQAGVFVPERLLVIEFSFDIF